VDGEWAIRVGLDSAGDRTPASRGPIDGKLVIGGGISDLYNQQEDGCKPDFAYRPDGIGIPPGSSANDREPR
jgi:hypothetical protein